MLPHTPAGIFVSCIPNTSCCSPSSVSPSCRHGWSRCLRNVRVAGHPQKTCSRSTSSKCTQDSCGQPILSCRLSNIESALSLRRSSSCSPHGLRPTTLRMRFHSSSASPSASCGLRSCHFLVLPSRSIAPRRRFAAATRSLYSRRVRVHLRRPAQVGSVFEVEIDEGASVSALKKVIKGEKPNDLKDIDADKLQVFLAKKDGGAWLTEKEAMSGVGDTTGLKLLGTARARLRRVGLSDKDVGGVDEEEEAEGRGPVNVLVVVPEQEHAQTGLWLVTGSVDNALDTRGTRCKLYLMATLRIGYYDPARRIDNKDVAFWYESKKLCFHVLFETSTCFIYRRCDVL
nr:Crinkler effector protein BLC01 [Phytophthora ramorum]